MTTTEPTISAVPVPPDWAVQYMLNVPTEEAAHAAAQDLVALGHQLIAVRVHDHFRDDPSNFWYGKPSLEPDLTGWWQVFSLSVHGGQEQAELGHLLRQERIRIATLARRNTGFLGGNSSGHATTLQPIFNRTGLLHEDPTAVQRHCAGDLPTVPAVPEPGPAWTCPGLGDPTALVAASVQAAQRLHGDCPDLATGAAGWLLDEEFNFGDPYDSAGTFLGDLADAVAHQGTCTPSTIADVPFLAELACDPNVAPGARVVVLGTLLDLATTGVSLIVSTADRDAALGLPREESDIDRATRQAVEHQLPRLLARWSAETDAWRFVCTALAAVPQSGATPRPAALAQQLHAPAGTSRADVCALLSALLTDDTSALDTALARITTWHPALAEKAAGPHVSARDLARSALTDLVMRDVSPSVYR